MFREDRGITIGIVLGMIAMVLIVGSVSIIVNNNCQDTFWDNLQVYPGAELISQQRDFLGIQRAVYHTPDAVAMVNEWYRTERADQMREAVDNVNMDLLPSQIWDVEAAEGNSGSNLTLETQCP